MGATHPTHRCLPLPLQDRQRVENLPHADAVQTVGGRQDRIPGRPPGEIRGELHHQEPAGEDARLAAQIRDRRPHISGQRRGADPLLIRHAAKDGQPAVRCVQEPRKRPNREPQGRHTVVKLEHAGDLQTTIFLDLNQMNSKMFVIPAVKHSHCYLFCHHHVCFISVECMHGGIINLQHQCLDPFFFFQISDSDLNYVTFST